jgi:predicted GNAT family acetyltransferase
MGLLDNALQAIKNQYQETKGNVGLLMSDPKQYMSGLNQDAAEYNRLSSLALQAERNAYRGIPVSQEQAAAKQYIDQQQQDMALGFVGNIKPTKSLLSDPFNVIKRDASETFGAGSERVRYIDPKSSGYIEVLSKPDNTASVMSLEVPEQFRGKKIGESLQARVLQDFPEMQGQVSSKAAAKTAYRLGRRPVGEPNATLDDVFKAIENNSSVNLVSPEMQKRFSGNLTTIYHGTTPQAAKSIEKSGFDINKSADGTIWFTSNPNIGEVAASGKGGVVKRMMDTSKMKLGGWEQADKYSTNELMNMGYDGLMLKDKSGITYQIFNPEKLKK